MEQFLIVWAKGKFFKRAREKNGSFANERNAARLLFALTRCSFHSDVTSLSEPPVVNH